MGPGATAFTRTPLSAKFSARERVSEVIAPSFAKAIATALPIPLSRSVISAFFLLIY